MVFFYFIAFIVLKSTPAFSDELIDHAHLLADDISKLYLKNSFSDVVLVVDNQRIDAHRVVLASRSDIFSSLLSGIEEDVPINKASATSFKALLKYIYFGRMDLSTLKSKVVSELSTLSNTYGFPNLVLGSTPAFTGEQIDHAHNLADDISKFYRSERFSDVVLVVQNERFPAHRAVLTSRSEFFRSLLGGKHVEASQNDVQIKEATAKSFEALLKYIYSGRMDLSTLENDVVMDLLFLSNKLCFSNLKFSLTEYLESYISVQNVCSLFDQANFYQLKEFEVVLLNFVDTHALEVFESEDFLSLSTEPFLLILNRDTVLANEMDLFRAACRWIKHQQNRLGPDDKTKILSAVRYELMVYEELFEVRLSEQVRLDTTILDVIRSRTESPTGNLNYRGQSEPNVNLADQATIRHSLIYGGTMIVFDQPTIINYIEMKFQDDSRTYAKYYSYYIEVSTDRKYWWPVIDYSNYHCRATQRLWINRRFVRYIRIVGTKETKDKNFIVFKVMYNTDNRYLVELKNRLMAPKFNVALTSMFATVISGLSKSKPNAIVNGDSANYNLNSGFTYHELDSGCIEVQLAQPYVLSSMRMLLWDHDGRSYGYFVDVSADYAAWERIVDRSNQSAQSWQVWRFAARPIAYIRITGVHSSKHDGRIKLFRCVHLEAPAQI